MLAEQLAAAIDDVRTMGALDDLARTVWKATAAGALDDDAAHGLLASIELKRAPARERRQVVGQPIGRPSIFPPRRPQPSPRTAKCLARRRQLAASGPLPPRLAASFTVAELAALRIVRDEVKARGVCSCSIAEIAARAGVGRTSVQNALRLAARLGLVIVKERRQRGDKNLPNLIRIASQEWAAWNATRPKGQGARPIGFKSLNPTATKEGRRGFSREKGEAAGLDRTFRRRDDG